MRVLIRIVLIWVTLAVDKNNKRRKTHIRTHAHTHTMYHISAAVGLSRRSENNIAATCSGTYGLLFKAIFGLHVMECALCLYCAQQMPWSAAKWKMEYHHTLGKRRLCQHRRCYTSTERVVCAARPFHLASTARTKTSLYMSHRNP